MSHPPQPLRPREIQDRVRAGESAEALAESSEMPLEKVLMYAAPVLAERSHVAYSALGASVRRSPEGAAGPTRTLGDAATARLVEDDADVEELDWDGWRREDGRWELQATYTSDGEARTAGFSFDQRGRFVTPLDDEGRWLVGDLPVSRTPLEPAPVLSEPLVEEAWFEGPRRLRLAPPPDLPETGAAFSAPGTPPELAAAGGALAEPALDAAFGEPSHVDEVGLTDPDVGVEAPVRPSTDTVEEGQLDLLFDHPPVPAAESGGGPADAQDHEDTAGLARRAPRKQRGRASVPTWDEIMFGGRD